MIRRLRFLPILAHTVTSLQDTFNLHQEWLLVKLVDHHGNQIPLWAQKNWQEEIEDGQEIEKQLVDKEIDV